MRLEAQGGKDDPATINEAMNELESNPSFAADLEKLLEKQK
jgi:hypothetical protein